MPAAQLAALLRTAASAAQPHKDASESPAPGWLAAAVSLVLRSSERCAYWQHHDGSGTTGLAPFGGSVGQTASGGHIWTVSVVRCCRLAVLANSGKAAAPAAGALAAALLRAVYEYAPAEALLDAAHAAPLPATWLQSEG